jgi:hypothetical protein
MAKILISAIRRPGYPGTYRAGRLWSSEQPTEIEVVDQDEDPEQKPDEPIKVGRKTFALLESDQKLSVRPAGDPIALARSTQDIETLRADYERLAAENEQLKAQLGTASTQQSQAVSDEGGSRRGGRRQHEGG